MSYKLSKTGDWNAIENLCMEVSPHICISDVVLIFVGSLCDNHTGYSNVVLLHVKFLGAISTYLV